MAFANHGPLLDEVVGVFGPFVFGVLTLAAGVGTATIPGMKTVRGCVASGSTATAVTTTGSTNVITFSGGTTDVVSYICWGDVSR